MKGNIFGVVVIACVLALGVGMINAGYSNAAEPGNATENTTVDFDQNYTLQETPDPYEFTSFNVTTDGGTELREGTDYLFDDENSSINWQNTTLTTDGDAATVAYDFRDHSETTTTQARILSTIAGPLGIVLMIVVLGTLLTLVARDPY